MPDHDLERLSALIFIDGRIIRDIQRGPVFFSPEKLLHFVLSVLFDQMTAQKLRIPEIEGFHLTACAVHHLQLYGSRIFSDDASGQQLQIPLSK